MIHHNPPILAQQEPETSRWIALRLWLSASDRLLDREQQRVLHLCSDRHKERLGFLWLKYLRRLLKDRGYLSRVRSYSEKRGCFRTAEGLRWSSRAISEGPLPNAAISRKWSSSAGFHNPALERRALISSPSAVPALEEFGGASPARHSTTV
jgi:hypothetical protein